MLPGYPFKNEKHSAATVLKQPNPAGKPRGLGNTDDYIQVQGSVHSLLPGWKKKIISKKIELITRIKRLIELNKFV